MNKQYTQIAKGIAILLVVLYHLQYDYFSLKFLVERGEGIASYLMRMGQVLGDNIINIFPLLFYICYAGVNVFFVLSGYGLAKKYYDKGVSIKSYFRQIGKLLFPYFLAIPLTFIINYSLQYVFLLRGIIDTMPSPYEIYLPTQYFESYLVPTRWFSDRLALNFVGTWWFIGVILQFYILFPLLLKAFKKWNSRKFLLYSILFGVIYRLIIAYMTESSPIGIKGAQILFFINFPSRLPEFAFGMYLIKHEDLFKNKKMILLSIIFLILGLILSTYIWGMGISDMFLGIGMTFIVINIAISLRDRFKNIFLALGKYSYHIYLFHEPALKMILKIIFPWIV